MPVVDGLLVPAFQLTLAERQVDYPALHEHILSRRRRVEASSAPAARRLALLAVELPGLTALRPTAELAAMLERGLAATARYGYRSARAEIARLRQETKPVKAYAVPDAGHYAKLAAAGLDSILQLVRQRARQTAVAVATAASAAVLRDASRDHTEVTLAATAAALKALHVSVLELIGETLNMGRTAGALALANPPEFALRSEQLDKATCDACTRVHGSIEQVGSDAYYRLLPPADCYGGGRCRGLMVFGDGPMDVRLPEAA